MERRKLKVFLDSNVILYGLISGQGSPRILLDLLSLGLPMLQGVTGRFNLTEIERNIARRFPAALLVLDEYLPKLDLEIVPVPFLDELEPFRGAVRDRDLPVLASAAMGHSDCFVTDNSELLNLIGRQRFFSVRSLAPEEFLNRTLLDELANESVRGEHRGRAEGSSGTTRRAWPADTK